MYELNRIRLIGIGPRGARYSDVTLDLSGLGEQIPPQNLFDAPVRRPAASSLLLLENGGGKSVLLKLIFSVVLPGRRNTVGGVSLDKFVLDGDTGHVALEWMHVTSGALLITGKAYQRRARSSADKDRVAEAWYSFRPSAAIHLDTLPVATGGRRRRLEAYREAVEEANRLDASTALSWLGEEQTRWREHLREQGIEPDLFNIQRRMNADEGEAAKAFKYTSSKDFVDWLLRTVTDPKDTSSVAETFSYWAENLAGSEQMRLEKNFLEGVITRLDLLAEANTTHQKASRAVAAATTDAETLAESLSRRLSLERENVARLAAELGDARKVVATRSIERDNTRDLRNEVRRQRLKLELDDVEKRRSEKKTQLAAIKLEQRGWETIPAIEKRDEAVALAESLAGQVAAGDKDAAPALARRDEAAGRLLAKYQAEAAASDQQAARHEKQLTAAKQAAAKANDDHATAIQHLATTLEQQRAARETIAKATDRLDRAAAEGVVPSGTAPAHLPSLVEAAEISQLERAAEMTTLKQRVTDLMGRVKEATDAVTNAAEVLQSTTTVATEASRERDAVETEGTRLGRLTVLVEAVGDDATACDPDTEPEKMSELSVDRLDEAADRLLTRLADDIDEHDKHLAGLHATQMEDTRVVEALGNEGLLPPGGEIQRILEVLNYAKLSAHSGWRYLSKAAPANERARLVAAHPALADGIVLVDSDQLPAARRALEQAHLLPAAAITVGAAEALLRPSTVDPPSGTSGDPFTAGFVVDPNPALFDKESAASHREQILSQMSRRSTKLEAAKERLSDLRQAQDGLQKWRRANPPGRLTRIRETAETALDRQHVAAEQLQTTQSDLDAALKKHECAQTDADNASAAERQAADHAAELKSIAELVGSAYETQRLLSEHESEVKRLDAEAKDALTRRTSAEREQEHYIRLAEQARSQANSHRAACDTVESTSGKPDETVPGESVAELVTAAKATQKVYLAVAVDPDLRRQADDAAAKAQQLLRELTMRDSAHVAEAERLRRTPAGADRASWSVGATNALDSAIRLEVETDSLTKESGSLESDIRNASPTEPGRRVWTSLSDRWKPTSPAQGLVLEVEAQQELREAQERLDSASGAVSELEPKHREAEIEAQKMNGVFLPLSTFLDGIPESVAAEPYAGDADTAQQQATAAIKASRATREAAEKARDRLSAAVRDLVSRANQTAYESLSTKARRSILESTHDVLASRAADWSTSLQARLVTLTSDLENTATYRNIIVGRLSALVTQALRTLRLATRLSQLPKDLADWAGRQFLRIQFGEADQTAISIRVGEVVDRVAADYAKRAAGGQSRNTRHDGMTLLLEAVHASVPKGFIVDVLKPDSVLRDERVTIEDMNEVFSGGQELTAAIVLYCTLAALSANERGRMRSRHSGVLFLDNPIGRANASYLIDLQQAVARSLGVQLIYTTGISDDQVLAAFPLWIRLRNDADLRAGLKHIRIAEAVQQKLPAPYASDEILDGADGEHRSLGTVTAARVYRQQLDHSHSHAGKPTAAL
ncbi:MAG: hypothetical protein LBK42_01635 [Propionibacteriaceae bacterium]|jgi:hypothetical protein|nr:hypothetical protein [Propionibacteriaceae bacterium]